MDDGLHLRPKHRGSLEAMLREYLPDVEVWAHGSRVKGRSHEGSDLDLVLRGTGLKKIPVDRLNKFQEALRESTIPFSVEARDWARLPERFRREIERDYVALIAMPMRRRYGRNARLGNCAKLVRITVSPLSVDKLPYVGLEHIGKSSLELVGHGMSTDVSSTKTRFNRGDILFGKLRPYFRKAVRAKFAGICSTDIWVLRAEQGIDPDFLFYTVADPRFIAHVTAGSEGTRMPRAKWDFASEYQFHLPSLPQQQYVGQILRALDDKIELNRRMNDTLEAMARAIFKDWFVDFGATRAKVEGRTPYLAPDLWDLFPAVLEEELPTGWRIGMVGDCFQLTMGQSPPGSTYNDDGEGLPFFQGRTDFGFRYPKKRKYCTEPIRIAERDDTLVSVRAPVGDINMAWQKCCTGRGIAAVRHRSVARSFTYYSVWAIQQELRQHEHTGTVFGSINKRQFESLKCVEPKPEIVALFERQVGPLDDCIRNNECESRTLNRTRNLLIPKLMSGEIRLAEAEEVVEAVA